MTSKKFNRVKGKQIFLTFTIVICTIILIWAWERTPLVATLLPSQEHFEIHLADHSEEDKLRQHEENPINTTTVLPITEQPEQVSAAAPVASIEDGSTKSRNEDKDTYLTPTDKKDHSKEDKLSQHEENLTNTTTVLPITEQPEQVSAAAPVASIKESSMKSRNDDEDTNLTPADKKECNYAKGKWVPDDKRPLYLGSDCKQWLSVMWACKLMQRTDFSYEGFKWQPENCEMPDFESSAFLKRMKDKTIAFVGDSLGRQQFQSLMCMATTGKMSPEVQNVGREYGLVKPRGAIRPDGWAYRFPRTNTTILYYWSVSLCKLEPLNISNSKTNYAMHLDRPAGFMKRYLHRFDVLVLNTGHHWNRGKLNANRWEMYVGGMPVKDRKLANIANARNFAVYSIVKWLDSQLPNHPRLQAFFRTLSPRHFVNGDWNTGGSCDNTIPLIGGSQISQNGSSDAPAETAVKGTNVMLLDITALSRLRDEGHISRYSIKASTGVHDCLHWCLPGIPDAWNEILYAEILSKDQQIVKVP